MLNWQDRNLREALAVLKWLLPVAIFLVVVIHQIIDVLVIDQYGNWARFISGLLAYGLLGPITTWWTLSWIGAKMDEVERAEARAREKEQYLATITSASADAILSLDVDSTIRTWNLGAELIFRYTADQILGQPVTILIAPEHVASARTALIGELPAADEYLRNFELECLTREGQFVSIEATRTLLRDSHGQVVGSSVILRDVTARRQAEQEVRELNRDLESKVSERTQELARAYREIQVRNRDLEQANEQLRELDRLKSEFVSMVSHELRAPLTNINGSVELMLQPGAPLDPENVHEMLQIISDQSARLTRLVFSILNVSRIEAGKLEWHMDPVPINVILDRVTRNMTSLTPNHLLQVNAESNLPPVWADVDRVEEVLTNLLDNALKYSPNGGHITVAAHRDGDRVVLSITDEGIGIPSKQLDKIFEKFHRLDTRDSREIYGHGLGLYIAKRLIEAQGGAIWVESKEGQGSTFSFALPMARQEAYQLSKADSQAIPRSEDPS
ncbi:MAG: PAS domain S-box protein [Chloroflexi bacterium]|nr:PAS domain S-box protein [Chloroflexota bacterium]